MATFAASAGVRFADTDDRVSFIAGYTSVPTSGGAVDSVNGDTGVVVLTAADVGAADENLTPRSVTLGLAVSAVDGTATVFDVIQPDPAATASGDIPAGWTSVATIPNLATFQGLLTSNYPSGVNVLVPAGANAGVYFLTAANVASAWPELEVGVGAWLLGPWVPPGAPYPWIGYRASATLFTQPASGNISHSPQGLDAGLTNLETTIENHEGVLDTEHWVSAYFDTTVIDPTDYATAPVTQPTPDGGIIVVNTDVLVLTAADTTKRGIWHIDADDGTWSQITYPDILIGNSFTVMINAEGDADDGVHFEWLDEDPTVYKRRSYAYPGSSATFSDGRNGRWIKYTPGGDTPVVGGQDEGPVVTATTATTLLDAAIPVTGAAGDHFKVELGGSYLNTSGSVKSPTITVLLGSTTVATLTPIANLSSSATVRYWRATIDIRVNGATDINVISDGQIQTSIFTVSVGSASEDIGAGVNLDVRAAVQSGGSQEVQLTQVSVMRFRA